MERTARSPPGPGSLDAERPARRSATPSRRSGSLPWVARPWPTRRPRSATAYVYGAAGPSAFDCSGLTMAAWSQAGVSLPHSSAAQYSSGRHISESELQPGDLVFYYSPISHVGMYIGNGQIVNAVNPSVGVVISGLHDMPYVGAVRPGPDRTSEPLAPLGRAASCCPSVARAAPGRSSRAAAATTRHPAPARRPRTAPASTPRRRSRRSTGSSRRCGPAPAPVRSARPPRSSRRPARADLRQRRSAARAVTSRCATSTRARRSSPAGAGGSSVRTPGAGRSS